MALARPPACVISSAVIGAPNSASSLAGRVPAGRVTSGRGDGSDCGGVKRGDDIRWLRIAAHLSRLKKRRATPADGNS